MNYETELINRAIQDQDLTPMFERGVQDDWFTNALEQRIWKFLREHNSKYGQLPSMDVLTDNFPTYTFHHVTDNPFFLIDQIIEAKKKAVVHDFMRTAIEDIEQRKDYSAAVESIQVGLSALQGNGLSGSSDLDLTKDAEKRWEEYLERKSLPNGLRGIPTGFATIDAATSGLQKGQLIVVVAPPKTGKSTLAMQIANNVHLSGYSPVFQSFEMLNSEQVTRYDSMRSRVSHHRLSTGALTPEEETRYQAKLKSISKMDTRFWLTESSNALTVSGIANKIQSLKPDVLFLDGVYLMKDEQSGEANTPIALTNITRSLKRLAQTAEIPIVVSTQALKWKMNKGQVTADSVGYSSSFLQDADVLFGLQREDENVDDMRILKVLASRNCGPMEVSMVWDWNTGDFREISGDDY